MTLRVAIVDDEAHARAAIRILLSRRDRVIFVSFDDIDWIQAADQYVVVHVGAKEYLLRESLHRIAARLPRQRFARIHRSHLINLSKVREVRRLRKGDAQVTLANGPPLRVSRRYRRNLGADLGTTSGSR